MHLRHLYSLLVAVKWTMVICRCISMVMLFHIKSNNVQLLANGWARSMGELSMSPPSIVTGDVFDQRYRTLARGAMQCGKEIPKMDRAQYSSNILPESKAHRPEPERGDGKNFNNYMPY